MEDKKSLRKLNAEKRKKQIQMDFLKREQALDKETAKILKEKWFEILLRSKLPELKENLRNVLDYMEKLVEIEVFRKQLFEEQRVDASVQLNMQAQNHSRALNDLYALYLQRINDLHSIYTEQVMKKKEEAENEFKDMKRLGKKNDEGLKGILFQMEKNQVKKEDQMKCDMFLKTDDEKSKNAEKTESLRMRLERFMDKRWNQISNILADYQQTTEVRRNHYAQLKARDEKDAKIISSQMKKTKKLYDQIQQLKLNLENPNLDDDKATMMSDYMEERTKLYNSFIYLKKVLAAEMKTDDVKLKQLTALSKDTLEYLDAFLKKGRNILTLYSVCLKLETEKEKVVPIGKTLYTTKIPHNLIHHIQVAQTHQPVNVMANYDTNVVKTSMLEEFQLFWKKVGKVRLSIFALSQRITDIKTENEALKKLLHTYFNKISLRS